MASRFKLARAGAGITGAAAVLLMAAAVPASAEPVTARVDGGALGLNVNVGDGFKSDLSTQLIGLNLDDGSKLGVYCVEIDTGIDRAQPLVEKEWDEYPVEDSPFRENSDQINWILHNGFPEKQTAELAKVLTERGTALNDGSLSVKEAVAGTQAAIWHFSDETDLDPAEPVPGDARSGQDVLALYELLIGPDNVGLGDEPTAALTIDPAKKRGVAGERIGPFTVRTTGTVSKLATTLPEGVRITDVDGRQVNANQVKNGSQLFFDVPENTEDGGGTFRVTANANVDTGRLFVAQNYDQGQKSQSMIVAQAEKTTLEANATATWAEADANAGTPIQQGKNDIEDEDLAQTGASILMPVIIGGVLVAAGVGSLLFLRRRRA